MFCKKSFLIYKNIYFSRVDKNEKQRFEIKNFNL